MANKMRQHVTTWNKAAWWSYLMPFIDRIETEQSFTHRFVHPQSGHEFKLIVHPDRDDGADNSVTFTLLWRKD